MRAFALVFVVLTSIVGFAQGQFNGGLILSEVSELPKVLRLEKITQ